MSSYYIIGVRMDNRIDNAVKFQEVLTKNGCMIKTRLGLHDISDDDCANDGIIVLQPYGSKEDVEALVNELNSLEGITARYIDLN
jgi:formate-dependent nitrite reductase cytochrome c552 subunit